MEWYTFRAEYRELTFDGPINVMKDRPKGLEYVWDRAYSIICQEIFSGKKTNWWSPHESKDLVFLSGKIEDDLGELEDLDVKLGISPDENTDFTVRLFVRFDQLEIWNDIFGEWIRETKEIPV